MVSESQNSSDEVRILSERVRDLSSLIEVSIIINSTLELDPLIGLVMEKAQSVMRAEACSVMLINEKSNLLECEVALGSVGDKVQKTIHLAKGQGIAGWVWEQQKPLIVPDVSSDKRFYANIDHQSGFQTKSILAAPLMIKERIIGVAEVINRTDGNEFDSDDLELFSTFCRQVALAIENARMHQLAIERERLKQQLESAKNIQQSFLPQSLPKNTDGKFELVASCVFATEVGGDLYDAVELEKNCLGLLIGDVSGKEIPAALFMARLMSDFRFFVGQSENAQALFDLLNKALLERARQGMFVTLQYSVIDLNSGMVSICDAGHMPVLLIPSQSDQPEAIKFTDGAPLGIIKELNFSVKRIQLKPGDTLFFYTDGLVEATNAQNEQFSLTRLLSCANNRRNSAKETMDNILSEVRQFSAAVHQQDDMTAMAFKWNCE